MQKSSWNNSKTNLSPASWKGRNMDSLNFYITSQDKRKQAIDTVSLVKVFILYALLQKLKGKIILNEDSNQLITSGYVNQQKIKDVT